MRLPLSESEYRALEEVAEKDGLTVDEEAQVAILRFLRKHDVNLFAELKKRTDPKVLQVLEKT